MSVHTEDTGQLVVFRAAQRDFAFALEDVDEVVRMVALEPLPETPPWLLGVMNLRGRVVPVIDLAGRLGLPVTQPATDARIIVVHHGEAVAAGMASLVREALAVPDEVSEVHDGRPDPASAAVRGVARIGDDLVAVLNAGQVFGEAFELVAPLLGGVG